MRQLSIIESNQVTGAGLVASLEASYAFSMVGVYTGFCAGIGATAALGLGPLGVIAASTLSGAASMYVINSSYTTAGGISGLCSGIAASAYIGPAIQAGSGTPIICASLLGGIIGMNLAATVA